MNRSFILTMKLPLLALAALILIAPLPATRAQNSTAPSTANGSASLKYKMITGYKQPFNDDLQLHLSKGWSPVGGVAITVWNGDLYYAQLISRPASQ
jgi:hypothetical protein